MIRLPRRFALWGGAAAIAMGGFAFMASNVVVGSSAGAGAGPVSGYTVTNITYTPIINRCITGTTKTNCTAAAYIGGVTFTLSSAKKTTPSATKQPSVLVYPENATGERPWGHMTTCTVTTWTTTNGTGTVTCSISATTHASQAPVKTLYGLTVTAAA